MTQVKLDAGLLDQLGMTTWQRNSSFAVQPLASESMPQDVETVEKDEEANSQNVVSSLADVSPMRTVVFLGDGLDHVWQNEALPEWTLFQNMLRSVSVEQEQALCFDSANIQTEDAVFMTLEEIIESGVDFVFTFDSGSLLNEHLAEGLTVVELPALSRMLSSSQAKKSCYYLLTQYVRSV